MSTLIPPPPPTVPLGHVIGSKVFIDGAWAQYLTMSLVERVGGYEAPSNTDLATALHDDAGIEELKADLYAARGEFQLIPPGAPVAPEALADGLVQALIAELAELRKEIDTLKAGTIL